MMKKIVQIFILTLCVITSHSQLYAQNYLSKYKDLLSQFKVNGAPSLASLKSYVSRATEHLKNGAQSLINFVDDSKEFINLVEENDEEFIDLVEEEYDEHFNTKKILLITSLVLLYAIFSHDFIIQDAYNFLCDDDAWIQLCVETFGENFRESCVRHFTTVGRIP